MVSRLLELGPWVLLLLVNSSLWRRSFGTATRILRFFSRRRLTSRLRAAASRSSAGRPVQESKRLVCLRPLLGAGSEMARALCLGGFDAFGRCLPSGMGLSCSRSELLADSAHLYDCCGDRRYGKRSNILLADLSACGRNVRCGADFGACCRSDRGGGHDGGCAARTTAVRMLFGPGTSTHGGCRRDAFAE